MYHDVVFIKNNYLCGLKTIFSEMKVNSSQLLKIFCLSLLEALIATYPNYTWVPIRIETLHPGELGGYWLSYAFRFICMVCFFVFQIYYNIYRLRGSTLTIRIASNLVMMFAFVVVYQGISAVTPYLHPIPNRGIHVVIYQVLIVGITNILIGLLLFLLSRDSFPDAINEHVSAISGEENAVLDASLKTAHYQDKILLPTRDRILPIDTADIAGFYTSDKRTHIIMADGRQLEYNKTLQQIIQSLDPELFFRANKQYIVARGSVKDITVWFDSRLLVTLAIDVPEPIYVSKNKAGEFKQWLAHV